MRRHLLSTLLSLLPLVGVACETEPSTPPPRTDTRPVVAPDAGPPPGDPAPAPEVTEVGRRYIMMLTATADLGATLKTLDGLDAITIDPEVLAKGVTFDDEATCRLVDYFDTRTLELRKENILLSESVEHDRCVHPRPKRIENTEIATLTHLIPDEGDCADDHGVLADVPFNSIRRVHIKDPTWATVTEWAPSAEGARPFQERSVAIRWLGDKRDTDHKLHSSFRKFLERRYKRINFSALKGVCEAPLTTQTHKVGVVKVGAAEAELSVVIWGKFEGEAIKTVVYELTWHTTRPEGQTCEAFQPGAEAELAVYKAELAAVSAASRRSGEMEDTLFEACR